MDLNSIFSGIGTQIIIFSVGALFGAGGHRLYAKQKGKQNLISGDHSNNEQINAKNITYIKNHAKSEVDVSNLKTYSNEQIENVIRNGDDTIRRKWCVELIVENKASYLIQNCISKMNNNKEKYNLLDALVERGYENIEYLEAIIVSLTSDLYRYETIKLLARKNKPNLIEMTFKAIKNNIYIHKSLIAIYDCDIPLFTSLYKNGSCFSNKIYASKMKEWINQK
ncbi:MAG: hypothetical protein FWB74_04090 [Defluviitaleaceae bacterium]|nr:hypothetical protein [Defluviitaleaceae bacterium]